MVENMSPKIVNRLISIDAFRGITIALMLIADNPGNPLRVYPQLRHAPWNGWTLVDLAFPFFILIMGMVIPLAFNRRFERGDTGFAVLKHIVSRSIMLFLVGLFLNGFPLFNLTVIRIPGVLQRLALVYLVAGLVYLFLKKLISNSYLKTLSIEISLVFGIILIYALIFNFDSVPEHGNIIQKIDLHFLKGHLYTPNWDPEGILSTFPSIASGLFGLVAGQILTHPYKKIERSFFTIFLGGVLLLFLGLTLDLWIPINKNIWSSTYVLFTSGFAYILVALLYFCIDLKKNVMMFKPFIILGSSPIIIYILSEIIRKTLWIIPITTQVQGGTMPMNVWLTTTFFTPWAGDWLDSFYFSISYVILWCCLINPNKRKI
jgi:Uncharacterized conserved protein